VDSYARFAEWHGKRVPSLLSAMAQYRREVGAHDRAASCA
jgi:hypothetical protein